LLKVNTVEKKVLKGSVTFRTEPVMSNLGWCV